MFVRSSSSEDYERPCSLDVLGLQSRAEQNPVHQEFKEQLEKSPDGWYQTGLIWKTGVPDQQNNESGSKARLKKISPETRENSQRFMKNMRKA